MSIAQRQHIRFSLDIPAIRQLKYGESVETLLHQISIGGCLLEWDENIFVGDEIRLLARMQNGNYLPLNGKALYIFDGIGIGINFMDITKFEQELLAKIISNSLRAQNLPLQIDPFDQPKRSFSTESETDAKMLSEKETVSGILDNILTIHE
ncbi:MAG: PilZ domain-containing protein [Pyrinomonadaceae bacterium]|nr:PilZ domain-containing protein [Pyrinomonadaceae bacterium]